LFTLSKNDFKVYNWNPGDKFIQYCDKKGIGVGVGDNYGLYIY